MKKSMLTFEEQQYILNHPEMSSRKIAKRLWNAQVRKSTINDFRKRVMEGTIPLSNSIPSFSEKPEEQKGHPKVLVFDIENSPNITYTFGRFGININQSQIETPHQMLCTSAKWLGSDEVIEIAPTDFSMWHTEEEQKQMLQKIWTLLDQAEYVIGHNAKSFDCKQTNTFFMKYDFPPTSPYRVIDTLQMAREKFKFFSNKLGDLVEFLGLDEDGKHDTGGMKLWIGCVNGDVQAWREMIDYCSQDVLITEKLYYKLRPWSNKHPNFALHLDDHALKCPVCVSDNVEYAGKHTTTNASMFHIYKCGDCGSWHRSRKSVKSTKGLLANV